MIDFILQIFLDGTEAIKLSSFTKKGVTRTNCLMCNTSNFSIRHDILTVSKINCWNVYFFKRDDGFCR